MRRCVCSIVDSADPEFFIAHADVELIRGLPDRRHVAARRALAVQRRDGTVPDPAEGHDRRHRGHRPRRRLRVRDGVRHALRRARQSGARPSRGGGRHHPRRRRDTATSSPGRSRASTGSDPRLSWTSTRRPPQRGATSTARCPPTSCAASSTSSPRASRRARSTAIARAKRAVDAALDGGPI